MMKGNGIIKAGAIAGAAIAITTMTFIAGDVVGTPPFASKSDVVEVSENLLEVASKARTNRVLILNDRLQRAQAEKRGYQRKKEPIPLSLEEWIRDLCLKLAEEGAECR